MRIQGVKGSSDDQNPPSNSPLTKAYGSVYDPLGTTHREPTAHRGEGWERVADIIIERNESESLNDSVTGKGK